MTESQATGFYVDTRIPYGNACDIAAAERQGVAEISFTPDPHGGPETLWFCLRIGQDQPDALAKHVRLELKHSQNMLGGHSPLCMRPVLRYATMDWERLGAPIVEELADGRVRVWWDIAAPTSFVDVAYCYPYGWPEVDALLRETQGYWQVDVIGVSQGGRPLARLSNDYGEVGGDRPGLYLVARQHSGETPGSWVLDGLLRHVASLGDEAPLVWAVPLTNVDGIEGGDYGKDSYPYDLNRAWGTPPMRHEVLVFQRDITRWIGRCRPVFAIDFHAPGACETSGLYGYVPDPAQHPKLHSSVLQWTTAIKGALTRRFAAEVFERVADYASRWETPSFSRYFWVTRELPSLSIETPYALVEDLVLKREHYQEAGARIAQGIVRRLRVTGG